MAFFKVALVLLGLAAVTLQAFGNPHDSEHNYQLFHKQRVGRGKRSQDESTGRVISQDLINKLLSLKGSSSGTTAGTTTTTTTITTPTTTTTTATASPTTTTTTNTTTARAPQYIIQRFSLNDFAYDDEIDDEEDNSRFALRNGNSYDNYDIYDDYDNGSVLGQDDADDEDNAILVENEQSSFDEVGRASRARPSNSRRREAQRRRQQRLRRRRPQGQRQRRRPNQRRRRGNPKKRVYRRRGPSNRRRRRPSGNNRRGGPRRRIVRIAV